MLVRLEGLDRQVTFKTTRFNDRISLIEECGVAPFLRCNIWHVRGRDFDLVIDTGMGVGPLRDWIVRSSDRPIKAICTHSHFDHVAGLHEFDCRLGHRLEAEFFATGGHKATLYTGGWTKIQIIDPRYHPEFTAETHVIHPAPLTGYLDEGDVVDLGDHAYQVLHLPGHPPGSIGLYDLATKTLFSGDAIYNGPLYDAHPNADIPTYLRTLQRLKSLGAEVIHGGHYTSFGADRLREIVETYEPLAPGMNDIEAWFNGFVAAGGDPFAEFDGEGA